MIILYNILTILLYPLIYCYLTYRKYRGKEDSNRFREKFGYSSIVRPDGDIIWIHVASVGEFRSIHLLVDKLINKYDATILITSITVSSAKLIGSESSHKVIHQYIPVDNIIFASRFIKYWKPKLILWIESELWPSTLSIASKKAPILLINSKLSDRSYQRWFYAKGFLSSILNNFTLIFPQSKNDLNRYLNFTNKVKYIGNLKYCAIENVTQDNSKEAEIKNIFSKDKRYILAASTHEGEEKIIAEAYTKLRDKFDNLFLIIAPRHPNRKSKIVKDLSNFNIAIRSEGDHIQNKDIYMVDTIGELKYFYEISDIVFVGGSLINIGGHNPLEAAQFNCAIIYGSDYSGVRQIIDELVEANAVKIIRNANDFVHTVSKLLNDESLLLEMQKNGKKLINEKAAILDKYLIEIDHFMK